MKEFKSDYSSEKILSSLRERAKELNCLYQVGEVVSLDHATVEEIIRALLEIIPPGWQHPGSCRVKVTYRDRIYADKDFSETPWSLSSDIVSRGERVGQIAVFYSEEYPEAEEGPFLREERRLLDAIAERLNQLLSKREVQSAGGPRAVRGASDRFAATRWAQDWWVVLDFLRRTDYNLLIRIARKMINYLCWSGVEQARALLQRFGPEGAGEGSVAADDNRPLEKRSLQDLVALTDETFELAADFLNVDQIVACIQQWIKEDKIAFLKTILEDRNSSLADIAEAIDRYRHLDVRESELSLSTQRGLRVSLIRRFLTYQIGFINIAKKFVSIEDFQELLTRMVMPPRSHGQLGGKGAGLFLAQQILKRSEEYADILSEVKVPHSWYIPSDGIMFFIHYNNLEDLYNQKYLEIDQVRQEYPHIIQVFKNSHFPPEMVKGLAMALDDLGDRPLIVRSSSLLEDRTGSVFSGKYKSLFLANQGSREARLVALMDAVAEVYASLFGPDPIEYRAERGLLDVHEEMGILIQEVVGNKVGPYFLPAYAGVAFSNNEFRWSPRIQRDDGLVRLVPGLGTRAVDRTSDDYPVLIAPGQPNLRVNVSVEEVERYAPKMADVINLETQTFETIPLEELLERFGNEIPGIHQLVSVMDGDHIKRPMGAFLDFQSQRHVCTFDGLIGGTPFVARMKAILKVLHEKLETPVDIEFASDGRDFYLLQCRPQSYNLEAVPADIPRDLPEEKIIFSAEKYVSNGRTPDITHIVYVDPDEYGRVSDLSRLKGIGRVIGRLNRILPKRQFVLMGPGRWGSRGDIKLGVSVTYSDLNNTCLLVEIAKKKKSYVPELSFGTHFFQDLVEANIRYLPLYPDDAGIRFNETFLRKAPSILTELVPEAAGLEDIVRVIDVPGYTNGLVLRVLMNADLDQALAFLASPGPVERASLAPSVASTAGGEHWRWRLRMAEAIAKNLESDRFGVHAFYVFGSTKNATAGPGSDIDLLVHFRGVETQRRDLEHWLEGWSRSLAEINYLRTGYQNEGLLDVHILTDEDIARQTSFAAKIGAVTDAARPLPMGGGG